MECSRQDALNLLESWWEQESLLNLWLAPPDGWAFRVVAIGRVEMFTPEVIRLALFSSSSAAMMVDITNAVFDYSDAREASPELKDVIERDVVCTLRITTPECRFALGEMREHPI